MEAQTFSLGQRKPNKFLLLFKMCKLTDKCLFAAGFGINLLVYYWATNFAHLRVINGRGKGSSLDEIHYYDGSSSKNFDVNDVFLDNSTGDYYSFKKDQGMWLPVGNVGIHYSKSAGIERFNDKLITRSKLHQSRLFSHASQNIVTSKVSERKCVVKKDFLHHWIFDDIPDQFVASNESVWNVHEVKLASNSAYEVNYNILVESEKGPEICEHKNTIAMQFHIDKHYECTIKILKNFIEHHILMVQEKGKIHMMIGEAENLMKNLMYTKGPHTSRTSRSQTKRRSKMDQDEVMEHKANATNSIRKEGIRPTTSRTQYSSLPGRILTTRASSRQINDRLMTASQKPRVHSRHVGLFHRSNKPQSERQSRRLYHRTNLSSKNPRLKADWFSEKLIVNFEDTEAKEKLHDIKRFDDILKTNSDKLNTPRSENFLKTNKTYAQRELTGEEIRRILHPTLDENLLSSKKDTLVHTQVKTSPTNSVK